MLSNTASHNQAKIGTSEPTGLTYWCFISYRHTDNHEQDRRWATWLHQEIEHYDIPAELVETQNQRGEVIPAKIYPVFRDEESLSAEAHLGTSILEALDASRTLIVLCSPRVVESQYVKSEINHFQTTGKGNRIITAIIAGEPNNTEQECFPEELRKFRRPDGSINLNEGPLAADFRLPNGTEGFTSVEAYKLMLIRENLDKRQIKAKADAYQERLQLMKLKIIAAIIDVPLEALRNRDQAYRLFLAKKRTKTLKRWLSLVGILLIATLVTAMIAVKSRNQAIMEEKKSLKSAYLSQIQLSSSLIKQNELANARSTLLSIKSNQRKWEWAYLLSLCGSTPASLNDSKKPGNFFNTQHTINLAKDLSNASKGASTDEEIAKAKSDLLKGRIVAVSSSPWRGGAHSTVYQGNPPFPLLSIWYGQYGEAGAITISSDGTVVAWDAEYGNTVGRRGNLSSGDLFLSSPGVISIPNIVTLPKILVSDDNSEINIGNDVLLRQDHLAFGPTSIDPIKECPYNVTIKGSEQVSFVWKEDQTYKKITKSINLIDGKYIDEITNIHTPTEEDGITLVARLKEKNIDRKFCCSFTNEKFNGIVLEGNGLELWSAKNDEKILSISANSNLLNTDNNQMDPADWWAHDATQIGTTSKIIGWHDTPNGRFLGIKDIIESSPLELLYNDNNESIPEPSTNGLPYPTATQMLSSANGNEIIYTAKGRNDNEIFYWNLSKSKSAASQFEIPRGVGWDENGRFTAVVDADGAVSLRESLFGKIIYEYVGVIVEAGISGNIEIPIRYSPDRSRILISNLLIDADSYDPILVLNTGTTISDDWSTIVTWIDSNKAQITSVRFWEAYKSKSKPSNLKNSELLLIDQISSLDN